MCSVLRAQWFYMLDVLVDVVSKKTVFTPIDLVSFESLLSSNVLHSNHLTNFNFPRNQCNIHCKVCNLPAYS